MELAGCVGRDLVGSLVAGLTVLRVWGLPENPGGGLVGGAASDCMGACALCVADDAAGAVAGGLPGDFAGGLLGGLVGDAVGRLVVGLAAD